jgi:hypothetical protein
VHVVNPLVRTKSGFFVIPHAACNTRACLKHSSSCQNHTRKCCSHTVTCQNHTHACQNHTPVCWNQSRVCGNHTQTWVLKNKRVLVNIYLKFYMPVCEFHMSFTHTIHTIYYCVVAFILKTVHVWKGYRRKIQKPNGFVDFYGIWQIK